MEKKLNTTKVFEQMDMLGMSKADIANALDVSRAAVSGWLRDDENQKFPRPRILLSLGKLLQLTPEELVIKSEENEPIVAFRKRQGAVTKDHHLEAAKSKGRYLSKLVKYLPFDVLEMPPVFKKPSTDYQYLQKASLKVRKDLGLNEASTVDFEHLIHKFNDLQAVIIPVLWGKKSNHVNALHVHLPDSGVTWVYLNLDTNIHDFKFWMAHEYGHCLSPSLEGDAAENFADAFAGALLFPENKSSSAYKSISSKDSMASKVSELFRIAETEIISPYTVLREINAFADFYQLDQISIDDGYFFSSLKKFNDRFPNVSESIFGIDGKISPKEYIQKVEDIFDTPIFDSLRKLSKDENGLSVGFVKTITDMPVLDVKSLNQELQNASEKNTH